MKARDRFKTVLLAILPVIIYFVIQLIVTFVFGFFIIGYYILRYNILDTMYLTNILLEQTMLVSAISCVLSFPVILPMYFLKKRNNLPLLSRKIEKVDKITAVCFAQCASIAISFIGTLVFYLISFNDPTYTQIEAAINSAPFYLQIIAVVVLGPICEEIVFRGLAMNKLMESFSYKTAIIVSSLFFALLHGNLTQGILTFFMGVALGYIYVKTGSLITCIAAHMINNCLAVVEMYFEMNAVLAEAVSFVILLVPAVVFVIRNRKIKVIDVKNSLELTNENIAEEIWPKETDL